MDNQIYLLATPFFPSSTSWRGAFGYDFVKALEKDGRYRVVVCKPGASYMFEGVQIRGYRQVALPSGIPCPILDVINKWLFKRALRREGVDARQVAVADAFVNGMVNEMRVVKEMNPKAILVTHHHDLASFGVSVGRFRHFLPFKLMNFFRMRKLQSMVDLHVYISEAVKRSFERFPDTAWTIYEEYRKIGRGLGGFKGVKPKDGCVLHNGVDIGVFKVVDDSGSYRMDGKAPFVIGCVGNFQELKDQATLIRAVARINKEEKKGGARERNIRVVFVGSGETLEKCKALAQALGVEAEFRSEVRHEELARFYRSLDLFVLPSFFEGLGCVYLEARACGVPFIGCQGQGIEDYIPEGEKEKWLCRPKDVEGLACLIGEYMEKRPAQKLTGSVDIDELVRGYLNKVEAMR